MYVDLHWGVNPGGIMDVYMLLDILNWLAFLYIYCTIRIPDSTGDKENNKLICHPLCWDLLGYQMVAWPTWREQAQHWVLSSPAAAVPSWESWEAREPRLILDLCQAANQWSLESMETRTAAPFFSVHPSVSLQSRDMQHPSWKLFTIVPTFHHVFSGRPCFFLLVLSPPKKPPQIFSDFVFPHFSAQACWCVFWGERERRC